MKELVLALSPLNFREALKLCYRPNYRNLMSGIPTRTSHSQERNFATAVHVFVFLYCERQVRVVSLFCFFLSVSQQRIRLRKGFIGLMLNLI